MRVLVVEDDQRMSNLLERSLEEEGYAVDVANDGPNGLWMAKEFPYGAIVLDVMLPGFDGFELCPAAAGSRELDSGPHAYHRDEIGDRVRGLDVGADDYLRQALQSPRARGPYPGPLPAVTIVLDRPSCPSGTCGSTRRRSGPGGARPSSLFLPKNSPSWSVPATSRHGAFRTQIIDAVWDFAYQGGSNVVDQYVKYLRDKVDAPFGRRDIETVRGMGYRLRAEESR